MCGSRFSRLVFCWFNYVMVKAGKESTEEFDNHKFARCVHNSYSDRCNIVLIDNANNS